MKQLYVLLFSLVTYVSTAQVGIGTTVPSGALDIESTTNGIVIPRIALTSRAVAAPVINPQTGTLVNGTLIWNTATAGTAPNNVVPGFYYWNAGGWNAIAGIPTRDWSLGGNAITDPATEFIGTTANQDFRVRTNNSNRFNFTNNGRLRAYDNGLVNLPTYSWMGDEDTGIWRPTADALGFTTNGVDRLRIHNNGISFFNTILNRERFRFECDVTNPIVSGVASSAVGLYNTGGQGSNQWTMISYQSTTDGGSIGGYNTNSSNNNMAVNGANFGLSGVGTRGVHMATTGGGAGVYGTSNSPDSYGVFGSVPNTSTMLGFGGLFTGGLGYLNGLYSLSDENVKKNIVTIPSALNKIMQIRGVSYNHDSAKYPYLFKGDTKTYLGFIAQEIKVVFPEVVAQKMIKTTGKNAVSNKVDIDLGKELLNVVDYTQLIPVLVEAVKEQQIIIENLKSRIEILEKK